MFPHPIKLWSWKLSGGIGSLSVGPTLELEITRRAPDHTVGRFARSRCIQDSGSLSFVPPASPSGSMPSYPLRSTRLLDEAALIDIYYLYIFNHFPVTNTLNNQLHLGRTDLSWLSTHFGLFGHPSPDSSNQYISPHGVETPAS